MWFDFQNFFHKVFNMHYSSEVNFSLFFLLVYFFIYYICFNLIKKSDFSQDKKRITTVHLRNTLIIFSLVTLFFIWNTEIKNVAISVAAIAAAITIAFKEVITSFIGGLMLSFYKPFNIGDIIEINNVKGEVIDKNLLNFVLLEKGNNSETTGKSLIMPNSVFLTSTIKHSDYMGKYTMAMTKIIVKPTDDVLIHEETLLKAAETICAEFADDVDKHINDLKETLFIDLPSKKAKTIIEYNTEKQISIYVRFACPSKKLLTYEQKVIREYLNKIKLLKITNNSANEKDKED